MWDCLQQSSSIGGIDAVDVSGFQVPPEADNEGEDHADKAIITQERTPGVCSTGFDLAKTSDHFVGLDTQAG